MKTMAGLHGSRIHEVRQPGTPRPNVSLKKGIDWHRHRQGKKPHHPAEFSGWKQLEIKINWFPYHPWDRYVYLNLVGFYGKCTFFGKYTMFGSYGVSVQYSNTDFLSALQTCFHVLSGDCSSLKETKRTGKMPIKKFRTFKIKAK